jgi:ribosomal protein S18 acetylase RimI-like enzyme
MPKRRKGIYESHQVRHSYKEQVVNVQTRIATITDARDIKEIDTIVQTDPLRAVSIDTWLLHDKVVVAIIDDRIDGYGVINHAFFRQSQLDMLMISEPYRGKGIGERLLQELEMMSDTAKFYVTTNQSNARMHRLLCRNGYKICGFIDELDPGDPEIVFFKVM